MLIDNIIVFAVRIIRLTNFQRLLICMMLTTQHIIHNTNCNIIGLFFVFNWPSNSPYLEIHAGLYLGWHRTTSIFVNSLSRCRSVSACRSQYIVCACFMYVYMRSSAHTIGTTSSHFVENERIFACSRKFYNCYFTNTYFVFLQWLISAELIRSHGWLALVSI